MISESILLPWNVQNGKMRRIDPMRVHTELFLVLVRWTLSLEMLGAHLPPRRKSVLENEDIIEKGRERVSCDIGASGPVYQKLKYPWTL